MDHVEGYHGIHPHGDAVTSPDVRVCDPLPQASNAASRLVTCIKCDNNLQIYVSREGETHWQPLDVGGCQQGRVANGYVAGMAQGWVDESAEEEHIE